jgi:hypothetical protein
LPSSRRQELIPFIERAMGSATIDKQVMAERVEKNKLFAKNIAEEIAAKAANAAYEAAYAAKVKKLLDSALALLNDLCPKIPSVKPLEAFNRAAKICELQS